MGKQNRAIICVVLDTGLCGQGTTFYFCLTHEDILRRFGLQANTPCAKFVFDLYERKMVGLNQTETPKARNLAEGYFNQPAGTPNRLLRHLNNVWMILFNEENSVLDELTVLLATKAKQDFYEKRRQARQEYQERLSTINKQRKGALHIKEEEEIAETQKNSARELFGEWKNLFTNPANRIEQWRE